MRSREKEKEKWNKDQQKEEEERIRMTMTLRYGTINRQTIQLISPPTPPTLHALLDKSHYLFETVKSLFVAKEKKGIFAGDNKPIKLTDEQRQRMF